MNQENENDLLLAYDNLKKELIKSQTDPWMLHVPMLRVTEILAQSLASSVFTLSPKEQERIIMPLIMAAPSPSKSVVTLISKLSNTSPIWDGLSKLVEGSKCISSEVLELMYHQRPDLLERHLLLCLQNLGQMCITELAEAKDIGDCKHEVIFKQYLGHHCLDDFTSLISKTKYKFLPHILRSRDCHFNLVFTILSSFLFRCNYSFASVKAVKVLTKLITYEMNLNYCPCEFIELWILISSPPCIQCNELLHSNSDINRIAEEISFHFKTFSWKETNSLRTILCMNCEWLSFLKSYSSIRILFLNTDFI